MSTPAIRYYESERLIGRAPRSRAGYRVYSTRVLGELAFIRRAQSMGLTLKATREILWLSRSGKRPCDRVAAICAAHVTDIDRRMAELRAFRRSLQQARRAAEQSCGLTAEGFCRAIMGARPNRDGRTATRSGLRRD